MGSKPDGETSEVQKKRLASEKFGLVIPGQPCPSSKKAKDSGSSGTCKDRCKEKGKVAFDDISIEQVSNSSRKLGSLFDFDKNRASMSFQEGDILTIRDEYGMPRRYARVKKNGEIRYLRRKDDQHDLIVPYRAVGEFLIGSNSEFLDPLFVSHKLLGWEMDNSSSYYRVFPKKGGIWAILAYIGVSYNKLFHPFPGPSPTLEKYQLVEVLEDYNYEKGTKVVFLVRVGKGCRSLFRRKISCGKDFSINISSRCMDLFSHQIPCFRSSGDGTTASCLQLDPSSIPLYIEEFEHSFACEINDNTLCLCLFDQNILKEQNRFGHSIVAAYDEKCGLPLKYVTNKSEQGQGLFTHKLVPVQERWTDPGFPMACGIYKKEPRTTEQRLIISHKIYPSGCMFGNDYDFCRISPNRGDVWAIFKERKMKSDHPKESLEYRIGYIVDERDTVREVAYLARVGGFKCLFRIKSASDTELIHEEDYFEKFSHQIPSYRFPSSCSEKILEGLIVLDPLLVPNNGEECFAFSDSFLLERSKAYPRWLAVQHFIDIEWNRLSLNGQEKIGKQTEEEDINVIEDQEIHRSGESGRNPEGSAHGTEGIESESNGNETSCKQFTLKLHNLHDSESEESFELGQIWALYDEYEGLPHLYARIDKFSPADGRMEVTPLEPHPMTDAEIQWIEERLPMACGTFRMSKSTCVKDVTLISYRVICGEGKTSKLFYKIFPRKGEVWAIFKNWDPTWTSYDLTKNLEYVLVEVLSSFTEKRGVTVAALVRAEGHEAIYRRQLNGCFELIKTFARSDLLRFSHCIPFRKMSIDEEDNTCGGSIQLKFSHKGI